MGEMSGKREWGSMKIHFFHTNDVHSHLEPYLQVASELRAKRAEVLARGEVAYAFEIGDHADRMRLETEGTQGLANAALVRQVPYDAWVFGNNEGLTFPKEVWPAMVEEAGVPVLVSNLFDGDTKQPFPFFKPWQIWEKGGVRVGVIGMTVPFFGFYEMVGVYAEHPRETFARVLPELRAQGVDLVVLLSHLGLNSDRQIAEEIEGIDIIFGGHTHQALSVPEKIKETWICQAGCYGEYYGHLVVDWDEEGRQIRSVEGGAMRPDPARVPDRDLVELAENWRSAAEQEMEEVVAILPGELGHAIMGNSPLAHVLLDEMRVHTGAPIAMLNGGILGHGLLAGPVKRADLLTCFPGPSVTAVVELSGSQILTLLQKSLDPQYIQKRGKGYGFRGYYVGGLQVSGLQVAVVTDDDGYSLSVEHEGRALDPDEHYEVAVADYLYFSPSYEEFKEARRVRFAMPFLRELLAQALVDFDYEAVLKPRWVFTEV
jgi:5'-nucleotidase